MLPRQMRMRTTTQPLSCPTVHAHNGLFPREGDQRSKLLEQVSPFLCVCFASYIHIYVRMDKGRDGFGFAIGLLAIR